MLRELGVHKGVKKEQNTMHCYLNPFREFAMYMVILVAVYLGVIIEQVLPPSHCLHWDLLTVIFKPCNSYAAVRYAVYIYGRPKPMYGHTNTELMGNFLVLHQIYIPSDIHSFRYTAHTVLHQIYGAQKYAVLRMYCLANPTNVTFHCDS